MKNNINKSTAYLILSIFFLFFRADTFAQLNSISISPDFSLSGGKRLAVTKADAVGGTLKVDFKMIENFSISIIGGYQLYSVQQDSGLIQWKWNFWDNRYRGNVNADLTDSTLKAKFNSIQKMDLIPIILTVNGDFIFFENLFVQPSIGGGIIFYTRRMFLEEEWSKYYEQIGYVFQYKFRNFAPPKQGNPFVIYGGINLGYILTESFRLDAGFNYTHVLETKGKLGYDNFPFKNYI
ncbi:MAG: hypothetical protein Q8N03_04140, partial [Ignavibacteria bacterium]|nr:hypothetical protein [Ignavibacteria bacterium]